MAMVPRVLVVDDDPVIRELLQAYLGEEGYDVLCAGNASRRKPALPSAPISASRSSWCCWTSACPARTA